MAAQSTGFLPPRPAPRFPTHHTAPDLSPQSRILCEILSSSPAREIETRLSTTQLQPDPEAVQQVLKLSYNFPSAAAKFFRWAGMAAKHTGYSWNLMVDLLGKNELFDPMWDAIRSMRLEGLLSLNTFVLVFENYCIAGRFDDAVMTFEVMEKYGIQPDIIAVNSLLSTICREDGKTVKALDFFEKVKAEIPPDADSFGILLEGWEKEGDAAKAKHTFAEMVIRLGWSPQYIFAYDAFFNTLVKGAQGDDAIKFLQVMKNKNCLPGLRFFSSAIDVFSKQRDSAHALMLWDIMLGSGLAPNLIMYNTMIGLLCGNNDINNAFRLLDEMVFYGAFPDSLTYNVIFECLIKNRKVRELGKFFIEMTKNEWPPTPVNFTAAIKVLFEGEDLEMAIEMWKYMAKHNISPLDDSANAVLLGFCNMQRMNDFKRFAEKMIDERIIIYEATMTTAKNSFFKLGRSGHDMYDHIAAKWKSSYV